MLTISLHSFLVIICSLSNGKKQKKRPALSGTQEVLADREKREKRARRFDQEKAAFEQAEQAYNPWQNGTNGGGNLASPLGAAPVASTPKPLMRNWGVANTNNGMSKLNITSQPSWQSAVTGAGKKWNTAGMHSAAFADAEVADPVSVLVWLNVHSTHQTKNLFFLECNRLGSRHSCGTFDEA